MLYLLAAIGAICVAVLLWRAFVSNPSRGRPNVPSGRHARARRRWPRTTTPSSCASSASRRSRQDPDGKPPPPDEP